MHNTEIEEERFQTQVVIHQYFAVILKAGQEMLRKIVKVNLIYFVSIKYIYFVKLFLFPDGHVISVRNIKLSCNWITFLNFRKLVSDAKGRFSDACL